ncbi:uncharacterized protein [Physcomitrium patens]|uniref:uncharacterized protein n=1 Tax=Physcomitrium patens TaxID=3218 RepID=UPI000D155288|nr:transmembrane protein 230-like [Physcomitrium patens]XP_024388881.1 transmembrane protein 230-like [Physcomitrium patens]XP_024388882.1 transmembrane protein 230-like [Physcomitrium patens]XP_024388883.1 transmembrane protein 230-like [Physcomitrium patens]|eukprot:XP_024388880.1 transmembrane protein 230-like [Physcomitrella patens]
MRGEMGERSHMRYSTLASCQDSRRDHSTSFSGLTTAAHEDLRYRFELPEDVPWKSIALAVVLLAFGCFFLIISHFIYTQHMEGDSSQAYGFLVAGILLFLPGFYETRIAYYSWRGSVVSSCDSHEEQNISFTREGCVWCRNSAGSCFFRNSSSCRTFTVINTNVESRTRH